MIGLSLIRLIGHLESKDHRRLKDRWRRSALSYSRHRNNNHDQGDQLTPLQVKEKWMEVMLTWTVMTKIFQKIKKPTHLSNLVTFDVMMHNIATCGGTLRPLVLFIIITINLIVASFESFTIEQ
ncbi:uncharacterized protein LOC143540775 [Bidens hawaiensis]|uniref:uncharacterized protein LOC143540775 n=1 Tax=Bidens hawaiensis TaxID=980011 RepID=UPI00404AD4A0